MAVSVGTWGTYSSTTSASSFTTTSNTLPNGAYLVVGITATSAFIGGTLTVSDSAGGSWTTIATKGSQSVAYKRTTVGTGGAFTITVASTVGGNIFELIGNYFTNATGAISAGVTATGTTTFGTAVSSAGTTDDLAWAFAGASITNGATTTFSAGSLYTLRNQIVTSGLSRAAATQTYNLVSAGTVPTTISINTPAPTQTYIVVAIVTGVASVNFTGWGAPI